MAASEIELRLKGYRLMTAEILYHMPDHENLLQTFIWQHLDLEPDYPRLKKFLDFWDREIEGRIHTVRIASAELIKPNQWHHAKSLSILQ